MAGKARGPAPARADTRPMDATTIIPTHARVDKLCRCVAALARQEGPQRAEVVVGFDGPDPEARAACEHAWAQSGGAPPLLRTIEYSRRGLINVRNAMIGEARGRVLISLNDDTYADPRLVLSHVREQGLAAAAGRPAVVVGRAPYLVPERDTLLNRMARETPLVFFYDVMDAPESLAQPDKDWGFRHCFGLNFSAPTALVREVGGFRAVEGCFYGHEDIELGFRLQQRFSMPVLYRPAASVLHDHALEPLDLIRREEALGRASWCFAKASPEFGRAVFGRDVTGGDELSYSRAFVERERALVERVRTSFMTLGTLPANAVGGADAGALMTLLYQQHLPLKRWLWRKGLLEAAGETVATLSGA